jgi:hypothetical protein
MKMFSPARSLRLTVRVAATLALSALAATLSLVPAPAVAQGNPFAGFGKGARFDGHMAKLFGENKNFSCQIEVEATPTDRPETVSMTGRLTYSEGKSRLEMDLTKIKGSMMPPATVEQLKAFGMAEMILINRPDTGSSVLVYPGLQSFARMNETPAQTGADDYKVATKELGREKVGGQDCVKNQVTVTGPDGKAFESTVWNATALKGFPVRMQSTEGGTPFTLTFKEVKFDRPAATLFDAPAAYTKYDDIGTLMRGALMKKLGEANGAPPGATAPRGTK